MLLVPAPTENRKAVSGARRLICFGCLEMMPAATFTIQSMPPAACISDADVTTARMMKIAEIGGSPGFSWKMNTSTVTPRPPHTPTPIPPARVPIRIAARTTTASRTNLASIFFSSSVGRADDVKSLREQLVVGHHVVPGVLQQWPRDGHLARLDVDRGLTEHDQ